VAQACPALLIRGILQNTEGVINVIADRAEPLGVQVRSTSRNFR
jgi:error-prone DNA polymerase